MEPDMKQTVLQQARAIADDLEARRVQLEASRATLEMERDAIAFDALTGQPKAEAALGKIIKSLADLDAGIAVLVAGARTAREKVAEAEGINRQEIDRGKAHHASKRGVELSDVAKAMDKDLRDFLTHHDEMRTIMSELHELGVMPSMALFDNASKRAFQSYLMGSSLKLEHLAPGDRRSYLELAAIYAMNVEAFIERKCGKQKLGEPVKELAA
jgi:hypothetical protein